MSANDTEQAPDAPACASWPLPDDRSYEGMWRWHGGRCGLCAASGGGLVEDHDHETGMVRGLLCRSCNIAEGYGNRSPRMIAWRDGVNSAGILGFEVEYVDPFTGMTEREKRARWEAAVGRMTDERMRVTMEGASDGWPEEDPQMARTRGAVNRLAARRRAMLAAS